MNQQLYQPRIRKPDTREQTKNVTDNCFWRESTYNAARSKRRIVIYIPWKVKPRRFGIATGTPSKITVATIRQNWYDFHQLKHLMQVKIVKLQEEKTCYSPSTAHHHTNSTWFTKPLNKQGSAQSDYSPKFYHPGERYIVPQEFHQFKKTKSKRPTEWTI